MVVWKDHWSIEWYYYTVSWSYVRGDGMAPIIQTNVAGIQPDVKVGTKSVNVAKNSALKIASMH